ncbi:hypothetical protein B0H16DRAFT_1482197 [Mycena metata]|uniref:Uncharacterized protein n=1 Tax=Mycena metata TaxID=1033252 RepID=A0AAD7GHH1_9AGAR|nr:hypothetical protein B0H16DRAFT_1487414 [Mycena metata]KAJ7705724.1 hypothetical protein B0H16DRAFT_1482197 [Mycena metata]
MSVQVKVRQIRDKGRKVAIDDSHGRRIATLHSGGTANGHTINSALAPAVLPSSTVPTDLAAFQPFYQTPQTPLYLGIFVRRQTAISGDSLDLSGGQFSGNGEDAKDCDRRDMAGGEILNIRDLNLARVVLNIQVVRFEVSDARVYEVCQFMYSHRYQSLDSVAPPGLPGDKILVKKIKCSPQDGLRRAFAIGVGLKEQFI